MQPPQGKLRLAPSGDNVFAFLWACAADDKFQSGHAGEILSEKGGIFTAAVVYLLSSSRANISRKMPAFQCRHPPSVVSMLAIRVFAFPPALDDAAEPFDVDPLQTDTALARPKFSLFKPSSELILNKLRQMRAAGRSEPPPAVCEVYRRSEWGSPGPSSPLQERCGSEGTTVEASLAAQGVAKTQNRLLVELVGRGRVSYVLRATVAESQHLHVQRGMLETGTARIVCIYGFCCTSADYRKKLLSLAHQTARVRDTSPLSSGKVFGTSGNDALCWEKNDQFFASDHVFFVCGNLFFFSLSMVTRRSEYPGMTPSPPAIVPPTPRQGRCRCSWRQ